jgi:hypothetical protein
MIEAKKIRFSEAISTLYKRTQIECNHRQTFLKDLIDSMGGYLAAKRILGNKKYLIGIASLKPLNRLDLSVEALVVDPQWEDIFTRRQLEVANQRLVQFGYSANKIENQLASPQAPEPIIAKSNLEKPGSVPKLNSAFN